MDRKKSSKIIKHAALLAVLYLAVSGCAFRGQDGSGQGDAQSATAGSGREQGSDESAGENGAVLRGKGEDNASDAVSGGREADKGETESPAKPGSDFGSPADLGEEAGSPAGLGEEAGSSAGMEEEAGSSAGLGEEAGSPAGLEAEAGLSAGQGEETGLSAVQKSVSTSAVGTDSPKDSGYDFTICFAGDINLDENWGTTQFLDTQENGIYDCISEELVEAMQSADIMCLNNEFTYSTGGSPLPGKAYTFRAKPERVEVLHQLGVDAVTLANNHVYDYGKDALLDTFTVLEEAEIPYFGAGRTLEDAMKPLYLETDGKRVALVGASRAEKNKMTPQATETEPGILRCYDTELYLQAIREGKENADFCIAFVHWGTEYSFDLEQVQRDTGREYLDAGADAVIGAHSHCLQGMEYYDGKPIIYSLGNYWFNEKTLDTMLLQLTFTGTDEDGQLKVQVIPAVQAGYRTTWASEAEEQRRIYDFLESISVNVDISDEGIVSAAEDNGTWSRQQKDAGTEERK